MIECVLVLAGILILGWLILPKKKKPVAVKRPAMPPVRSPAPPRQEIPYSQGRLVRPTSRDDRSSGVLDDILSVVEDIADVVTTRKHSRSDDDHAFSPSSNWDFSDD